MPATKLIRPHGQSLAVVVFGPSALKCLRFLKPGYQHCFVATQDGGQWHLLEPLSNGMHVSLLGGAHPARIIDAFRDDGFDAIAVQRQAPVQHIMPLAPFTCVEAVKRVLGLHARWVLTPWQLRRYLGKLNGDDMKK